LKEAHRAIAGMLAAMLLASAPALAEKIHRFDIPSQSLSKALQAFAEQSGVQLVYFTQVAEGRAARAVVGTLPASEALKLLLEDSGLEFEIVDGGTVEIRTRTPATTPAATPPSTSSAPDAGVAPAAATDIGAERGAKATGPGVVAGHVIDAASGRGLSGALVRIVETGQAVAANDLGSFRFSGLAPGEYTLTITYLGYLERSFPVRTDAAEAGETRFALTPSMYGVAEITIFGNRSARALALNQQRTADNNAEVIAADMLGNFTGTTISESLRRVAGISFVRDPTTGSGTNIMIRGLEPDMNAVKLNGLHLPVGNGTSRSANLNNILADSVSKITIHKTLLASHDSAGTGGLVEIETKSPLERPARYVNFAVEGGRRGADFGDNFLLSGTASRAFGARRNLGLSASLQYGEDTHNNSAFLTELDFGEYLPLSPLGTPTFTLFDFDPRTPFPLEPGAAGVFADGGELRFTHSESESLALTLSGEWQPSDITSLKLDIQHARTSSSAFDASGSLSMQSDYVERPVAALGGEVRRALTYGGIAHAGHNYVLLDGQRSVTDTYSFRGSSTPGKWKFVYGAGFAHGADRAPRTSTLNLGFHTDASGIFGEEPLGPADFLPQAVDPTEGVIITPYPRISGRGVVLPLFAPHTWARFNEADNYHLGGASQSAVSGLNDRFSADANATRQLGWHALEHLEVGVNLEKTRFRNSFQVVRYTPRTISVPIPEAPFFDTLFPSLAPLGLDFRETDLSRVGHAGAGFDYLDERGVRDFFANIDTYAANPDVIAAVEEFLPTDLERGQLTDERSLASYLQAKLDFGKLDLIAGVRLSRVQVRAVSVSSPVILDEFGTPDLQFSRRFARLLDERVTQTDLLPRLALNFRHTDYLVFRGGYFLTTARPNIGQLSSREEVALLLNPEESPNQDRPSLKIQRGNPGLKPAITHNLDIDAEYYHQDIGIVRLGAFYKRIENSLQNTELKELRDLTGIDLPDDPRFDGLTAQNTFVSVLRPVNSERPATLWGAELHVERQLTFLPGWLGGFGVFANFAYSDSKATRTLIWQEPSELDELGNVLSYRERRFDIRGERFNLQPATSGTAAVTYNRRGIDATFAYGFQDRHRSNYGNYGLSPFAEGVETLDIRAAYFFPGAGVDWRVFLEGTDLLKGPRDPDLQTSLGGNAGVGRYFESGSYLGGREFRLGISATF
jgi:TonB-dependent receptor